MPSGRPPNSQNANTNTNTNNSNAANQNANINVNSNNHSSVYPIDTVIDVADQLGIPNLKPQIASPLASDIEYRIRHVAQEAAKFMRHAKRSQLKTTDVDAALRASNIEPIYGFLPSSAGRSTLSNSQNPSYAGPSFRKVQTSSGPIHFVEDQEIDFEQVLCKGGIRPKLKASSGVGWGAHWLAVEGIQPSVPENPSPLLSSINNHNKRNDFSTSSSSSGFMNGSNSRSSNLASAGGAEALLNSVATSSSNPQGIVARPLIKHILSRELQLYYERLTSAITKPPAIADEDVEEEEEETAVVDGESTSKVDAEGDVSMSSAVGNHSNSKSKGKGRSNNSNAAAAAAAAESKRLLKTFSSRSSGNTVRDAALASLRGDPGLHQLVPYLVQWIGEKVSDTLSSSSVSISNSDPSNDNLNPTQKELDDLMAEKSGENVDALSQMMNVVHALLVNPHLYIEPYLHQLLPSILSVLLTASISTTTKLSGPSPTSLRLRSHASSLLAYILNFHGSAYPTLRPRIVKTLIGALLAGCPSLSMEGTIDEAESGLKDQNSDSAEDGPRSSPGTKLGAILGLKSIGIGAVKKLLEPTRESISESNPFDDGIRRSSPLARIGRWLDSWEKEKGEEENKAMVEQIKRSLYALVPPLVLPSRSEVIEKESTILRSRYGNYWYEKLRDNTRARRALAFRNENDDEEVIDSVVVEEIGDADEMQGVE